MIETVIELNVENLRLLLDVTMRARNMPSNVTLTK